MCILVLVIDTYHKDFGGDEKYYLFENRSLFEIFEKNNFGEYKVIELELIKNRKQIDELNNRKEIEKISEKLSPEERDRVLQLLRK